MPDYMFLLDSRLSAEQRAVVARMQEISQAAEINLYLTGGAVRDLVTGMPIRDLDFTIEGSPARFVHELEKPGAGGPGSGPARIVDVNERLRHVEVVFPGEVDGSIAASRDDVYSYPGAKPEIHWAPIMNDLRRRDFSMNAVAVSLNPASRGLLLDPTNGLADLERREVRAMTNHSFTNQPVRLLRAVRYCARLGFKMDARTEEWFRLAMERRLHESLDGEKAGAEMLQLAREDKPAAILKAWEEEELLVAVHPQLARRHPDYDGISRTVRVRDSLAAAGFAPGRVARALLGPMQYQIFGRLKSRERTAVMNRIEFTSKQTDAVNSLESEAAKAVRLLMGPKTSGLRDAYNFLNHLPLELLIFIQTDFSQAKALGKIKKYIQKWRPLRQELPAEELEKLGIPRGPKFDKVLEQLFDLQLNGRGRNPEDRTRLLRQLAGLKPEPKKKKEEPPPTMRGKKEHIKPRGKPEEGAKGGSGKGKGHLTAAVAAKRAPERKDTVPAPKRGSKPARKAARKSKPKKKGKKR